MFPPLPLAYRQLTQKHHLAVQQQNQTADINSQQTSPDMDQERDHFNSIETPFYLKNYRAFVNRFMNYRRRLMVQERGVCNFHDIHGLCEEPLDTSNVINSKREG